MTANISDTTHVLFAQLQDYLAANLPTVNPNKERPVEEAIELFQIYNKSVNKRPKTIEWHLNSFKHFRKFFENHLKLPLYNLEQDDIDKYRLYLLQKGLAVESVNNILRSLSAFLNWAHKRSYLSTPIVVEKVRGDPAGQKPVFNEGEFKQLLAACDKEYTLLLRLRARAILLTLYSTGMRASELVNARWIDIRHIEIDGETAHLLKINGAKRGGERLVILSEAAWLAIQEYREDLALPHGGGRKLFGLDPAWLFVSQRNFNEPLSVAGLQTILYRLGREAQVKVHPHKFRHDFATRWVNTEDVKDEDLDVLQKLAGWQSREMLKIYTSYRAQTLVRSHRKHN